MRKGIQKIKDWGYAPLSLPVFGCCAVFAAVCFGLVCMVNSLVDNDMYFMLSSGKEIVENGIPTVNLWAAEPGMKMVIQQWLYAVCLYHVSQFGNMGFFLLLFGQVVLFVYLCLRLLRCRNISWKLCLLAMGILLLCFQSYLFGLRPQLITVILLLCDCLALEKFGQTEKRRYLLVLPVAMLLEMNLHMAMWPFHFCVLLAYLVPTVWFRGSNNPVAAAVSHRQWSVFGIIAAMVGALFLNPYGIDGILYVLRSVSANTFQYVSIVEMRPVDLLSGEMVVLLTGVGIAWFVKCKGRLWGPGVNMLMGFGLLTLLAIRNYTLLTLPMLFLLRDFGCTLEKTMPDLDWEKDVRNHLIPLLVSVDVLFAGWLFLSCQSMLFSGYDGSIPVMDRAVFYIQEHWDGEGSVFVGFGPGGYFEYAGIDKVYLDARPELFMKELNEKRTVMAEYAVYCEYGDIIRTGSEEESGFYVTKEQMDGWIQEYDFAYICVAPGLEPHLYGYMLNCEDYVYVPEASSSSLVVYEKRGDMDG